MIEQLNLKGQSTVEVFLGEKGEELYKQIMEQVMDGYYPELTGWMAHQQLPEKADKCKTVEEVEELKFDLVPPDFFEVMYRMLSEAKKPDGELHDLSDAARIFLLVQLSERIIFSAKQYMNTVLSQRAQRIMREKPRIITP